MGGHGKGQLYVHAGAVTLHRRVDEGFDLGKFDDLLHLMVDLGAAHALYGAVQVDVFPAGEVGVEARAHFQKRGHAPAQADLALRRGGDARDEL